MFLYCFVLTDHGAFFWCLVVRQLRFFVCLFFFFFLPSIEITSLRGGGSWSRCWPSIHAYFYLRPGLGLPIRSSMRHLPDIYTAKAVLNTWIKLPIGIVVGHGALSHFQ